MSLLATYQQFLSAPNPALLASDASLHYVTTVTSFNGPDKIIKHMKTQSSELSKKEEKILGAVQGPDSIAVEVYTTIEFMTGGGTYLPKLDDNFVSDHTATLPIIHMVSFDGNGLITQIRQSWDQGSLLKLIDVIGRTGRNWPLWDGKEQIQLITTSVKSAGNSAHSQAGAPSRPRENSNNVTRDPHASLALFAPRDKTIVQSQPGAVAPRSSARPALRDYHDLFVGNESDQSPQSQSKEFTHAKEGFASPGIAKGGAGKNFAPSRLFDQDDEYSVRPSPSKPLIANKYQHFAFDDGTDAQNSPRPSQAPRAKSKHDTNWGFEDFNTPAKVVPSKGINNFRSNDVRHWGDSDNEVVDSPVKVKKIDKPRRDAETHFEFKDDGIPPGGKRVFGRPRGAGGNSGMGLYTNNLYDDENGGPAKGNNSTSVKTIANTNDRRKDFDPHFAMADEYSPIPKKDHVSDDRAKAIKMMDANWSAYDPTQSPLQKENIPASPSTSRQTTSSREPLSEATNMPIRSEKGINIAGDGMGSRKAAENQEISHKAITVAGDGMGSRKVVGGVEPTAKKGINVGGDGMGGRKGTGRQWGFGDDSDAEDEDNRPTKHQTGKTQGKPQPTGGDFWDF
ncbi:hypothetical protein BJ878DRAFT_136892 [Calycina marina]|uniref:Uncharacterized protein n=1 Tax=Calycina marina TaxID=1763456 RepID=A0A9P7Z0G0_9HELO|nr:hypothetical protein BJ878DRAFT_136892 [Calycina marina]